MQLLYPGEENMISTKRAIYFSPFGVFVLTEN